MKLYLIILIFFFLTKHNCLLSTRKGTISCPGEEKDEENVHRSINEKEDEKKEDKKINSQTKEKDKKEQPAEEKKDKTSVSNQKATSLAELLMLPPIISNSQLNSGIKGIKIKDKKSIKITADYSPELTFDWNQRSLTLHGLWADNYTFDQHKNVKILKKKIPFDIVEFKKEFLKPKENKKLPIFEDTLQKVLDTLWTHAEGFKVHEFDAHAYETGFKDNYSDYYQMIYHLIKDEKHLKISEELNHYIKSQEIFTTNKQITIEKIKLEEILTSVSKQEMIIHCNTYLDLPELSQIRFVYQKNYEIKFGSILYHYCYGSTIILHHLDN